MRHAHLFAAGLLLAACTGTNEPASGTGGQPSGAGGTAGTAETGGSSGADINGDPDAMTGTRCDNGIGAGGDGCAESWSLLGHDIGFTTSPDHLVTNVSPTETINVRGVSFYTIPETVLETLKTGTSLQSIATGQTVPVVITWVEHLTWDQHDAMAMLTPVQPLPEGWYAIDVVGSLDTGHSSLVWIPSAGEDHHRSVFRVGSAPILRSASACGGVVTLSFSEAVTIPDPAPVTVKSIGLGQLKICTRDVSPGTAQSPVVSLVLQCPELNDVDGASIAIAEGIAAPSLAPLKNAAGATTMLITLDESLGSSMCRTWYETAIPSF